MSDALNGPPVDHGATIPGELGSPLPTPARELSDGEKRAQRRRAAEASPGGVYGIVIGPDGKMRTTSSPE